MNPEARLNKNDWLAKPSGQCCLKGTLHQGKPQGQFIQLGGMETYISRPPAEKANGHILLYFPDVWGMFSNGLLVMDAFAQNGYIVLGPDYFRGDPVWKHRKNRHDHSNPDFDYEAWKRKHITFTDENLPRWIREAKLQYGQSNQRFVCVGYCFGAPYVCDALRRGEADAGAFAHPAFLKDHHFQHIERPLFLSCAEEDHTFNKESRLRALSILQSRGKTYQFQLFSNVEHGFALRGNMENPYERYVKEQSLKGIVDWFNFWLAQKTQIVSKL